ncbi:DnaB-like helicase C-terminal domain-containing protein [Halocella sp. SP3-1]|uniref:replicative DNA helicase n=1 Tax=Halocella sp. SP3-1 TaxID=2382161 RepID=UPI000F762F38|nr:DnaB-like helicase C-terminal domain-containing protein [Halocella sp. SP3-1]AZO96169.1 hypothetical protein D7D81_17095 [Halocella sp. SP3-1]
MKNIELEYGFISSLISNPDILDETIEKVTTEYLYDNKSKKLFKEIKKQYLETGKISKIKILKFIKGEFGQAFADKLLSNDYFMPFEIDDMVKELAKLKVNRDLYNALRIINNEVIKNNELNTEQKRHKAQDIIFEVTGQQETKDMIKNIEDVSMKSFTQLLERKEGKEANSIKIGYPTLDGIMGGLKPGHLTVLAGATSMGKTALGLNIAHKLMQKGVPLYLISLEMVDTELVDRILIQESKVSATDYTHKIDEKQEKSINIALNKIYNKPVLITDEAGLNISQIKALSRRAKKQEDVKVIIIDYLTMIQMESTDNYKAIGKVVTQIRDLAKELHVPIILLHQLNRNVSSRSNPRPLLSDLRDSGEIEERADEVIFVYRPEYYDAKKEGRDESRVQDNVEVIVAKNRTGKTSSVLFTWYPEILYFQDGWLYEKEGEIYYLKQEG